MWTVLRDPRSSKPTASGEDGFQVLLRVARLGSWLSDQGASFPDPLPRMRLQALGSMAPVYLAYIMLEEVAQTQTRSCSKTCGGKEAILRLL